MAQAIVSEMAKILMTSAVLGIIYLILFKESPWVLGKG